MVRLEFSNMIIKKFEIKEREITYYVGINQLKINPQLFTLTQFFKIIEEKKNNDLVIQIFNNKHVLNSEHVFNACYFLQIAFLNNINISNKKNIELLLYLATKRQIKIAIQDFGINEGEFNTGLINLCSISSKDNLDLINREIEKLLNANKLKLTLDNYSFKKYEMVKRYFNISDNQINSVLNSYGTKVNAKIRDKDIPVLYIALNDLICERMALLSLERVTLD
jgi:tRNA threonylcarbamoyladenosine modification (KEOPS) complex Cgi121 subunit